MFRPKIVAMDYETALLNGEPSVEYYRSDFVVTSCAFAWFQEDGEIKTAIRNGEKAVKAFLEKCKRDEVELVVHNYQFEWGVTKARFPGYEDLVQIDTMRLAQMADNGGNSYDDETKTLEQELAELDGVVFKDGLGLEDCSSRFLGKAYYKHKKPFLKLIKERGGTKGDFHLLTQEELNKYNELDAEVTLMLYKTLIERLADKRICWKKDHLLYKSTARLCELSKIRGVHVRHDLIDKHIEAKAQEFESSVATFRETFLEAIKEVEEELTEKYLSKYKTEKHRLKAQEGLKENPIRFNFNSGPQKQRLFCDKLGIVPKFFTEKGAPTFSSKYWFQWGEGGRLMKDRGTLLISEKQGKNLRLLSEYDGKWHISIKAAGTRTGRLAGGSME